MPSSAYDSAGKSPTESQQDCSSLSSKTVAKPTEDDSNFEKTVTANKVIFSEFDNSNRTSMNDNIHAVASGTYGSSDMLGASSVFSDEVFNSRQDAPLRTGFNY